MCKFQGKKWFPFYKASGMPAFTKKDSTKTPDIMFSPTYDLLFENELCGHRSIGKACDMYKFFFLYH